MTIARIDNEMLVSLTAEIIVSYASNNQIEVSDVAVLIRDVHAALVGLGATPVKSVRPEPAVPIRSSIKPDHIVCLEDGRKMKTLKRHLMSSFNMTPEEYRARWGLPAEYPMVAPDYAAKRSELAKQIGLGRKPGQRRGRPRKNG